MQHFFRSAAYLHKVSNSRLDIGKYKRWVDGLVRGIPKEGGEFRHQFDELVPENLVQAVLNLQEKFTSLRAHFESGDIMTEELKNQFVDIEESWDLVTANIGNAEVSLKKFKNTDFYPQYVISAVVKMLGSLDMGDNWLESFFNFVCKILQEEKDNSSCSLDSESGAGV